MRRNKEILKIMLTFQKHLLQSVNLKLTLTAILEKKMTFWEKKLKK